MKAFEGGARPATHAPIQRSTPPSQKAPLHRPGDTPPRNPSSNVEPHPRPDIAGFEADWEEEPSTHNPPPPLPPGSTIRQPLTPTPRVPLTPTQTVPNLTGNLDEEPIPQGPPHAFAPVLPADPELRRQQQQISAMPSEQESVDQSGTKEDVDEAPPRLIKERSVGPGWERTELPSLHVFYPEEVGPIQLGRFGIMSLAKLHRAMVNGEFTQIVDVLDDCCNYDIRNFTVADFYYIMYWERINSYPASPFTIDWTSRYGNKNTITVHSTSLDIQTPKITREEVESWREQGIVVPTVRDMELLQSATFDTDEKWIFERAQFLIGKTYREKRQKFLDGGIALAEKVREFRGLIDHGVREVIKTRDPQYQPDKAVAFLRNQVLSLRRAVVEVMGSQEVPIYLDAIADYEKEIAEIETAMNVGQQPQAREEEVGLSINATRFFPGL